jgi:hypothetical protein
MDEMRESEAVKKLKEMAAAEGYTEYKRRRIAVTTTISHTLWEHLKKTNTKLSRWIDAKEHDKTDTEAAFFRADVRALASRLDTATKARFELEKRVAELEKVKV